MPVYLFGKQHIGNSRQLTPLLPTANSQLFLPTQESKWLLSAHLLPAHVPFHILILNNYDHLSVLTPNFQKTSFVILKQQEFS